MKTRCVIVAGGNCLPEHFNNVDETCFVIAADSGLSHCNSCGVTPDLIVGDFDSFEGTIPSEIEAVRLPSHKDDTDLMYAARCGVERNFKEFIVLGGYGSRPDQNMAMYQTLCWIVDRIDGAKILAVCDGFEVYVIKNGSMTFKKSLDRYLSVFAIDGDAIGVDIIGAEYPLKDAKITSNFPVGVSNVAEKDTTVSVKSGKLLIMLVNKNI